MSSFPLVSSPPYNHLSLIFHFNTLIPFFFPHFIPSLYIIPRSLILFQGSLLEATVYGFEPYSQYSVRVEAVNGAGRLNLIVSHLKQPGSDNIESGHWTASLRCFMILQEVCPVHG